MKLVQKQQLQQTQQFSGQRDDHSPLNIQQTQMEQILNHSNDKDQPENTINNLNININKKSDEFRYHSVDNTEENYNIKNNKNKIRSKQYIQPSRNISNILKYCKSFKCLIIILFITLLSLNLYTYFSSSLHFQSLAFLSISTTSLPTYTSISTSNNLSSSISSFQQLQHMQDLLNDCPTYDEIFYVYLHKDDQVQMSKIKPIIKEKIKKCQIKIVNIEEFQKLIKKWNKRFTDKEITQQFINTLTQQNKHVLAMWLNMFFHAGAYIDYNLTFRSVKNKCWRYSTIAHKILFPEYTHINQHGIYQPIISQFHRVHYPWSPEVESFINQIIKKKNMLEYCEKKQCLIIPCFNQRVSGHKNKE